MLRITRKSDTSSSVVLLVEGQIRLPWTAELEREVLACRDGQQDVILDFGGVTYVSVDSVEILKRLVADGAKLANCLQIVEEFLK